ncbi:DNA cytosine methyltransferase, partial [Pelistega indica]|uniref:DNA cytosine methyltransferase n=1 Tax=Pelistega indica TaxID=1414851 RepID=UPI001C4487B8
QIGRSPEQGGNGIGVTYSMPLIDVHPTLTTGFGARGMDSDQMSSGGAIRQYQHATTTVRRLTPTECERLQGFPDGYTKVPYRGKPADQCPDGPRYKALGNSWAVPVVAWLGKRINKIKELENE